MNENHSYEKVIVIKILVESSQGRILLIQEPEMNEWMPSRWGLPGGRPFEKESLRDAATRKLKEEIGVDLPLQGIYKIEELLIDNRTVLMFIAVAKSEEEFTPGGSTTSHKWADATEINKMNLEQFTEYYSKGLFTTYLSGRKDLFPLDILETHTYYLFSGESEYKRWWNTEK